MNTYDQIEEAITKYFGDTSRSPEETRNGLTGLRDHIETLLEALATDGDE
ncbi:MAG: hypothetical protein KAX70_00580 [Pseudomonas sp.]|nr:hypothetical protein [Pseudomonas sp.]